MYLRSRPAYYSNGDQTIAVHYTAHARDLESTGWKQVEIEVVEPSKPEEEAVALEEVVGEAVLADTDLGTLTKSELLSYAAEIGIEIKGNPTKAEIISLINAKENG